MSGQNDRIISNFDTIVDNPSLYGFTVADWLDDSFTDEHYSTNTVQSSPRPAASKSVDRSKTCSFKIYEDHGGVKQQNVVSRSPKNSKTKVLRDRTNIDHHGLQMSTKNRSPLTKRTREMIGVCKENHKTRANSSSNICGPRLSQRASVVDCKNSAENSAKLPTQPAGCDVGVHVSKTCSAVYSNVSRAGVIATVNDTRTVLSSTATAVTASCQISSVVTSSLAVLTSSSATIHSVMTSVIGRHISMPHPMTYASPVCSVTICSSVLISASTKHQPIESIRSSSSSSSAVRQLCPSSVRTPQNQSSVRSSFSTKFSTPGTVVTPCNQSVQNSTMRPTPPMCGCGCRAKRKFVQSPGQNMGRPFYCCGSSSRASRKGCNFFRWENGVSVRPVTHSSEVTPLSTKQYLSMQMSGGNKDSTTPLSHHARQATSFHVLVPPSFK